MGYEVEANKYNFKCLLMTLAAIEVLWMVAEIGLFVVEKKIMRTAVIPITIMFLVVISILLINGLESKWVKYIIITTEILGIHIMGTMLTYHIVIFYGIPFLMAAHYQGTQISIYTLTLSLIGMIFVVVLGYYIGICDLNMIAFTKDRMSSYGELAVIPIYSISWITQLKVMAYFYFPRAVVLVLFEIMTLSIAESGRKMQERNMIAEFESTHDEMTGVFNKNKYLYMVKNEYPKVSNVGVIFFDVNGLKTINDTLGHEMGDALIKSAAKSLKYFETEYNKIYRMGGDEFIFIMENTTDEKVEHMLKSWQKILDASNAARTDFKCEMASGYAIGAGKDIEEIVKLADDRMYKNKIAMKGFAR